MLLHYNLKYFIIFLQFFYIVEFSSYMLSGIFIISRVILSSMCIDWKRLDIYCGAL